MSTINNERAIRVAIDALLDHCKEMVMRRQMRGDAFSADDVRTLKKLETDLVRLQRREAPQLKRTVEKFKRCLKWAADHKADVTRVELKTTDGQTGVGLVARSDISGGTVFAELPASLVLSTYGPHESVSPDAFLREDDGDDDLQRLMRTEPKLLQMPSCMLMLRLCYERYRAGKSMWSPYLDTLPTEEEMDLPMTWPIDDLLRLRGTTAWDHTIMSLCSTVPQYHMLHVLLRSDALRPRTFETDFFTWRLFRWAKCVAQSRQNPDALASHKVQVAVQSGRLPEASARQMTHLCLMPVIDMANHRRGAAMPGYRDEDGKLVLGTRTDVAAGEPLCMDYGRRSNHELFLYQGFVMGPAQESPEHDYYEARIDLPALSRDATQDDRKIEQERRRLAAQLGFVQNPHVMPLSSHVQPMLSGRDMSFLRVRAATADELRDKDRGVAGQVTALEERLKTKRKNRAAPTSKERQAEAYELATFELAPLSDRNEIAVLDYLASWAAERIEAAQKIAADMVEQTDADTKLSPESQHRRQLVEELRSAEMRAFDALRAFVRARRKRRNKNRNKKKANAGAAAAGAAAAAQDE